MYCSIVLFFLVRLLQFVSPKSSPFPGPLGATWQAQRWQLGLLPNTNKNHNSLNKSYPHSIQTLTHHFSNKITPKTPPEKTSKAKMKHWTPTQNHNKQHTNIYALKPPFSIFPIILGMSSSQLTNSYFFRGVGIPPTRLILSHLLCSVMLPKPICSMYGIYIYIYQHVP